ncbi:hypothetical protein [Streptomyces turgidiscabies]|uniref:Secreted protein n=1 Tax=Streptomyces turgidiscabies TaxID=85558 RepID=A0ABU0RWJ0_9ACTN|nr:hypothetical protein [Streptomyces turgidiscabies]MDQ0936198.1 hypothetical protein [Streptomyces turgidiscabies]
MGVGLPFLVALAQRGVQGDGVDGGQFPPVSVPVEVGGERRGEAPDVGVETRGGGLFHGGEQDSVLGGEPGLGLRVVRQLYR